MIIEKQCFLREQSRKEENMIKTYNLKGGNREKSNTVIVILERLIIRFLGAPILFTL